MILAQKSVGSSPARVTMENYLLTLISRLEWVEDDIKLVGKYKNMKLTVHVVEDEITSIEGWRYIYDDWDVMYEINGLETEIRSIIKEKFLYG